MYIYTWTPKRLFFGQFAYDHIFGHTAYMPKFRILSCTHAGVIMTQFFFQYVSNIYQYSSNMPVVAPFSGCSTINKPSSYWGTVPPIIWKPPNMLGSKLWPFKNPST